MSTAAAAPLAPAKPEPYLTPKEVQARMEEHNVYRIVPYWRRAMRACPASIRRGRYVRFTALWEWWLLNPDWVDRPRRRERQQGCAPCTKAT